MAEPVRVVRWAVRLLVSAALIAAVGAVAHVPIGAPATDAVLRVDLRTRSAKIEICREPTDADLAGLPVHMRRRRICTETAIDYRLRIVIDGEVRADRTIEHRGVRRNRPLIAEEMLRVAAGSHRVEIEFLPIAPTDSEIELARLPAHRYAEEIDFAAGRIEIVHLEAGALLRADS